MAVQSSAHAPLGDSSAPYRRSSKLVDPSNSLNINDFLYNPDKLSLTTTQPRSFRLPGQIRHYGQTTLPLTSALSIRPRLLLVVTPTAPHPPLANPMTSRSSPVPLVPA